MLFYHHATENYQIISINYIEQSKVNCNRSALKYVWFANAKRIVRLPLSEISELCAMFIVELLLLFLFSLLLILLPYGE